MADRTSDLAKLLAQGEQSAPTQNPLSVLLRNPMPQPVPAVPFTAPEDFSPAINRIGQTYPALRQHLGNVVVQRGTASDGRQLEFYPPWEDDNPNPGKITLELYNKGLKGNDLHEAIAGDLLHHLGSIDPRTNQPVDPAWMDMKQKLIQSRGLSHNIMDAAAYHRESDPGSYDDWMQRSRADAYIRGGLFPAQNPDWQKPGRGAFTPEMHGIFDQMRSYLTTEPEQNR